MTKIIFAMYNPETDCVEVSLNNEIHVSFNCEKCNASVYLNVLCRRQDFACMTLEECRTEIKWEEILCDMPYEISYD